MKAVLRSIIITALILQIVFASIPTFAATAAASLELTEDELVFINDHPVIHLAVDPQFYPYEFFDTDGIYKGIAADYLKLISESTGITFVPTGGLTWTQAYEKAATGSLDMLGCVLKTSAREALFNYSKPYYNTYRVIYVSNENDDIHSFDDLNGKRVAVQTNSSHHSYLEGFPEIELVQYQTVDEALAAVSDGREAAFVGNFATSSYIIKSEGITNLQFVNIEDQIQQGLHFAVRKDWPELVSILDKALANITSEEKIAINNTWIGVESKTNYENIIRIALIVGAIVVLIFLVSAYWIVKLRKEIFQRKQTEEALQIAKNEAEQANHIKSTFLARMSHEIRTPLHAISGMSYIMKKTSLSTTQQIYLDKISRASKDMLGIINDILDFSKIESGKLELERVSFNLDDVLEQLINIVSFRIDEQKIDFSMHKDPDIPNFFWGDPKRLEQILINLVNNAIKFTLEGEVSLTIRRVAKVKDSNVLEFSIKDSGIGMTHEQVEMLFKPFSQADSSITRRFGGTGLGLSIVKSFVDMMGGSVAVYSEPGVGSTFNIQLSFEEDRNKDYEARKDQAFSYFKNIRALIVESSNFYTNLMKEYLQHFNIISEFAKTDERAIQMLENASSDGGKPFNLLIVDYDTPIDHGIEFFNRISKLDAISEMPKTILLVPLSRDDLFDSLENAGIDLGITKPIIPSVLYNGITELFKHHILEIHEKESTELFRDKDSTGLSHTVMVVDDNKTNQFIAKSLLEQDGYQVILCSDGKEGHETYMANQATIDLILMDLHMPVMNGYEATTLIRQTNPTIPIVAMTADAVTGAEEKSIQHGLTGYISKPFEPEHFLKIIGDLIKSSSVSVEHPDINSSNDSKDDLSADALSENIDDSNVKYISEENALDFETGIKFMGGNASLYDMILSSYYTENRDIATQLRTQIDAGNYSNAIQIIHKLKSSSGSIGAKPLYEVTIDLQQALRDKDLQAIDKLSKTFEALLEMVLKKISKRVSNKL